MIKEIKEICDKKGLTISVSESLTSGLIQSKLASVSGSSTFFVGGLTVYNIDQKVNLLGVDKDHAESVNCVSERVAQEMSNGCIDVFNSDISIAITGYAEPYEEVETPFCHFAINYKGEILQEGIIIGEVGFSYLGEVDMRNINRNYFTNKVIQNLLNNLKEI